MSASQVHRITIDSKELRLLLDSELMLHPSMQTLRKKLTMAQIKEAAGINGAYTKSNIPRSNVGILESAFASELAQMNETPEQKEAREAKELEAAMQELETFQTKINEGTAKL